MLISWAVLFPGWIGRVGYELCLQAWIDGSGAVLFPIVTNKREVWFGVPLRNSLRSTGRFERY